MTSLGGGKRAESLSAELATPILPGFEASTWQGIGAPKNTPAEIVDRLNKEINAVLTEPETTKRLVELGGDLLIGTPEAFGAMITAETEKWKKVIEGAGIAKVE